MSDEKSTKALLSDACFNWWNHNIRDRTDTRCRGLAARLRRATPLDAMMESEVRAFLLTLREINPNIPAERALNLVGLLALLREHDTLNMAKIVGGPSPRLSIHRFQRLMRAESDEFLQQMPTVITVAGKRCNIGWFGADILNWGEYTKRRWCMDYFA